MLRVVATGGLIAIGFSIYLGLQFKPVPPASGDDPTAAPSAIDSGQTVRVTREDLTVVLSLDAQVVPTPEFTIAAVKGQVDFEPLKPGATVKAGQKLLRVAGRGVTSPVPAELREWLVPNGAEVPDLLPVARLKLLGFGMQASVPAADAHRILAGELSAKAQVTGGPGPFDCTVLAAPVAAANGSDATDGAEPAPTTGTDVLCAVPTDLRVVAGASGRIALRSGVVKNALVVPATAVNGTTQRASVYLVTGGSPVVRNVTLGATNGTQVQITDGLNEGDEIAAVPPDLEHS